MAGLIRLRKERRRKRKGNGGGQTGRYVEIFLLGKRGKKGRVMAIYHDSPI